MKNWYWSFLLLTGYGFAQVPAPPVLFQEPLSPRLANYDISAKLDPAKKMIYGKEVLTWINHTSDNLPDLQFHLYLNGFKNNQSTFMKEGGSFARGFESGKKDQDWGWCDVKSIKVNGVDYTGQTVFIHPDDENQRDETVLRVPLKTAVKGKETIRVEIEFESKLPRVSHRTGFAGSDFYFAGQWFPKMGVYEATGERYATKGEWNCHQFHANTEFFADYGVYNVDITIPKNFVLGATGVKYYETENPEGTKTYYWHAEDVHDFAWTCSPHYQIAKDQWQDIELECLYYEDAKSVVPRYFQALKHTLDFYKDWVYLYPFKHITIVDPPYNAAGAGGMEYPTLFTAGSVGIPFFDSKENKFAEVVVVHEFGHNYWYFMIGSNEFEEAWLDEGFTQFHETKIMNKYYGKGSFMDFKRVKIDDRDFTRTEYSTMSDPKVGSIFRYGWTYKRGGYGIYAYMKPAMVLWTLNNYLGEETFHKVMDTYFNRFKFKHPTTRDFVNVVNEVTGKDFFWFFNQAVYGTDVLDYAVTSIQTKRLNREGERRGWFGFGDLREFYPKKKKDAGSKKDSTVADSTKKKGKKEKEPKIYESKIMVSRLGEFTFPEEVEFVFENGKKIRDQWDGQDRWKEFVFVDSSKVVTAVVDPDQKIWLDLNFNNNSFTTESYSAGIWKYTLRWLFWIQNMMLTFAITG